MWLTKYMKDRLLCKPYFAHQPEENKDFNLAFNAKVPGDSIMFSLASPWQSKATKYKCSNVNIVMTVPQAKPLAPSSGFQLQGERSWGSWAESQVPDLNSVKQPRRSQQRDSQRANSWLPALWSDLPVMKSEKIWKVRAWYSSQEFDSS